MRNNTILSTICGAAFIGNLACLYGLRKLERAQKMVIQGYAEETRQLSGEIYRFKVRNVVINLVIFIIVHIMYSVWLKNLI